MAHGLNQSFDVVIASGASTSSEVNMGRGYSRVFVDITGAGGAVSFQGAPVVLGAAGTYQFVRYPVASGMSAPQTATVASSLSGALVEVPLAGLQFVKIVATGTVANGATLKIIGSDC